MGSIFISYRRQDTAGHTGRLVDWLVARLGEKLIFRDLEYIEPGEDFVKVVHAAIASCKVLLAVIGQGWTSCVDHQGLRRLYNPGDLVRSEIRTALEKKIWLIPVLVQGATMPLRSDLPDDLQKMADLNATELSDKRWHSDCALLGDRLLKLVGTGSTDAKTRKSGAQLEAHLYSNQRADDSKSHRSLTSVGSTGIRIGRGLKIENSTVGTIAGTIIRGKGLVYVPAREISVLEEATIKDSNVSEILGFKNDS